MSTKHKEAFLARFPRATIEGHTSFAKKRYYLVRTSSAMQMPYAEGSTKAQAWRKAALKMADELSSPV